MIRTEIKVEKAGIESLRQRLTSFTKKLKEEGSGFCCNCCSRLMLAARERNWVKTRVLMRGKDKNEK